MAINTATNFKVGANLPIDDRQVVSTYSELANLLAYEGLITYVKDEKIYYEYSDSSWKKFETGGNGGETRPLKEYVESGVTEKQLEPNKYYIFDSQVAESLVISFAEEDPIYLDEFMGEIKVDESPINVTFPNIIRWNDNGSVTNTDGVLTLEAKNTYLFSVANSLGLITNIPNPSLDVATLSLNGNILIWNDVDNAISYSVYNNDILLLDTTSTNVDLSEYLAEVGVYSIKVISKSNYFTDSMAQITYNIVGQLDTPTNLTLSDTGILTWDSVDNATLYEVYEDTNNTKLINTYQTMLDLTTITTLPAGTYSIRVKAINSSLPDVYLPSELSEPVTYTWEAAA